MIRSIYTVAKRELRSYFDYPTAYVLVVAFIAISLFLTFRNMYASNTASMRPLFDLLPVLFSVFVPAATMRSFAEERRGLTLDWLLAHPVSELEVVVGKFLGDWAFVMLALLGTLPTAVGVLLASTADPGIVCAQYIGGALLAGQLVALGLWASSITRNQITAFIVAAVSSFVLFLIGLQVVQIGLPTTISGALAHLSVVSHFQNVARGVIDLRDVLYFVSTGAFFLVLAGGSVARARLSRGGSDFRRLRMGSWVVAVLILVVNLLGSHVRGRLDLTRDHLFTLAQGTRKVLGNLNDLVQVKLFVSDALPPEVQLQLRDVRDLLSDMKHAADGKLVVTEEDPDKSPAAKSEAESFGIGPIEFNVLREQEFQVKRGYYGLAVIYANKHKVFPVIQQTSNLEYRLVSAIAGMTRKTKLGVSFVSGFGAKGSFDIPGLRDNLQDRYTIRSVDLTTDSTVLSEDSTKVLVLAGPTQTLDSAAVRHLEKYVSSGGAALLLLPPVNINNRSFTPVPVQSGLDGYLKAHGVIMGKQMVMDLASSERVSLGQQGLFSVVSPYPLWPIVFPVGNNPVTQGLNAITLAWASPVNVGDSAHVTALLHTSKAGALRGLQMPINPDQNWSNVPREDLGVRTVAVAENPGPGAGKVGRMVVVGDAAFVGNQFIQNNPQNLTFVANAIDWLAQDEALMGIRSKNREPPDLRFSSNFGRNMLKWGNLVGIPLLFVLFGLVRVTGRRRRAEARWREVVS
jgi:ABC-type uncharacterized transport system involved in gliding motility auxiliary subunit/ABC-type transport system involved in multi-copper enzyme maturation permease subunit